MRPRMIRLIVRAKVRSRIARSMVRSKVRLRFSSTVVMPRMTVGMRSRVENKGDFIDLIKACQDYGDVKGEVKCEGEVKSWDQG